MDIRWDRQFDEAYDYPPTDVTVRYVLCTTGRSGSHFLGHLLHTRKAFGYPLEYMNKGNLKVWEQRATGSGMDVLDFIKSVRTSPNGCFGIKLHRHHLARFLQHERRGALSDYRFVLLRRRDLAAQAASYLRAEQTGAWISEMPERASAVYNRAGIESRLERIAQDNASWEAFVRSLGLTVMGLVFEDVRDDPEHALQQVADFLGVDLPPAGTAGFQPQKQSKGNQEDWAGRFVAETWDRFTAGERVAGMPRVADRTPGLKSLVRRLLG